MCYLLDCPSCGYEALDGEMSGGQTVLEWQYCEECDWIGNINLCRVQEFEWGTARVVDSTFVRPDLALLKVLKGRLHFTPETLENLIVPPSHVNAPVTAPCPQCGRIIQLEHRISEDQTAIRAFWFCDSCGFKGDPISIPAPGLLRLCHRRLAWRGTSYELTKQQSMIIETLYLHYRKGQPTVLELRLMADIGLPNSRARDCFRRRNSELWGTLIIKKGGTLRLNL